MLSFMFDQMFLGYVIITLSLMSFVFILYWPKYIYIDNLQIFYQIITKFTFGLHFSFADSC